MATFLFRNEAGDYGLATFQEAVGADSYSAEFKELWDWAIRSVPAPDLSKIVDHHVELVTAIRRLPSAAEISKQTVFSSGHFSLGSIIATSDADGKVARLTRKGVAGADSKQQPGPKPRGKNKRKRFG